MADTPSQSAPAKPREEQPGQVPDVELVLSGADGVLSTLRPNAVVVDMSSISPAATRKLAAMVAAKGAIAIAERQLKRIYR